mmetsp:Transcript_22909/g.57908  ORF Transcript_22909/g.57908 Transcript_22909/m.57908 type:complete len:84 (-) Transcript_22909:650-901(-)
MQQPARAAPGIPDNCLLDATTSTSIPSSTYIFRDQICVRTLTPRIAKSLIPIHDRHLDQHQRPLLVLPTTPLSLREVAIESSS